MSAGLGRGSAVVGRAAPLVPNGAGGGTCE